jgi:hypothetical protein
VKFAPHVLLRVWKSVSPDFALSWYRAFVHSLQGEKPSDENRRIPNIIPAGPLVASVVSVAFAHCACVKASAVQNVFAVVLWIRRR